MAEALIAHGTLSKSQVVWDCSFNWEVNYLLKLNTGERPIANKYCEGKMKRCLKRQSKVPEIVERESIVISVVFGYFPIHFFGLALYLLTRLCGFLAGKSVFKFYFKQLRLLTIWIFVARGRLRCKAILTFFGIHCLVTQT